MPDAKPDPIPVRFSEASGWSWMTNAAKGWSLGRPCIICGDPIEGGENWFGVHLRTKVVHGRCADVGPRINKIAGVGKTKTKVGSVVGSLDTTLGVEIILTGSAYQPFQVLMNGWTPDKSSSLHRDKVTLKDLRAGINTTRKGIEDLRDACQLALDELSAP